MCVLQCKNYSLVKMQIHLQTHLDSCNLYSHLPLNPTHWTSKTTPAISDFNQHFNYKSKQNKTKNSATALSHMGRVLTFRIQKVREGAGVDFCSQFSRLTLQHAASLNPSPLDISSFPRFWIGVALLLSVWSLSEGTKPRLNGQTEEMAAAVSGADGGAEVKAPLTDPCQSGNMNFNKPLKSTLEN